MYFSCLVTIVQALLSLGHVTLSQDIIIIISCTLILSSPEAAVSERRGNQAAGVPQVLEPVVHVCGDHGADHLVCAPVVAQLRDPVEVRDVDHLAFQ